MDVRGKTITTYILYNTVKAMDLLKTGEILEVFTEYCEATGSDLKACSRKTVNKIFVSEVASNYRRYYIQKAGMTPEPGNAAIIISDNGLPELLSPLGFALGAALSGNEVYHYFQGPAVRALNTLITLKEGNHKDCPFISFF